MDDLKSLGSETQYHYDGADAALLERFESPFWEDGKTGFNSRPSSNQHGVAGQISISAPEFTSLCPKTGQPDFATIVIEYVPRKWCVESKSLKIYLGSYRGEGMFHESCVNKIANDLITLLDPQSITVQGQFSPRGGIPFWPTATWERK